LTAGIEEAFRRLGDRLARRGVVAEIYIFGGAAMALAYDSRRASEERRQDPIWLRGVKYTFVTAIEACVDVAQHICATEGWGLRPTTATPSGCSESTKSSQPSWLSRSARPSGGDAAWW
jgi:hypothetical protein